ncbi:NepR family anti-sigma factor [Microvirga brassicacearum]|uniref:NepR family anti-sigma factor n=1 Tax=Microvirga brassicacearum TaxID=2580413 RepID=UPI003B8492C4
MATGAGTRLRAVSERKYPDEALLPDDVEPHHPSALRDGPSPPLSVLILARIKQGLRAAYQDTVYEPFPVRLADLVERLGRRERGRE